MLKLGVNLEICWNFKLEKNKCKGIKKLLKERNSINKTISWRISNFWFRKWKCKRNYNKKWLKSNTKSFNNKSIKDNNNRMKQCSRSIIQSNNFNHHNSSLSSQFTWADLNLMMCRKLLAWILKNVRVTKIGIMKQKSLWIWGIITVLVH